MTTDRSTLKTFTPHPVNVTHLVVGLVFLGLAASWALRASGLVSAQDDDWLFPGVLVLAGVAGLLTFATRGRRRTQPQPPGEAEADIATLEATAFAPYPRDVERTRLLDEQTEQTHPIPTETNPEKENDR